jgi:putative transposase
MLFGPMKEADHAAEAHAASEEIITKLRKAEVLLGEGSKVPEVVKALGISEVTCDRWRKEYGGLSFSPAKHLKESRA